MKNISTSRRALLVIACVASLYGCASQYGPQSSKKLEDAPEYGHAISTYIGLSKKELQERLGPPNEEMRTGGAGNRAHTTWLYYKQFSTTFGLSPTSDLVMKAIYPTKNAEATTDKTHIQIGYGLILGLTKEQVEYRLGAPSDKAAWAWIYCRISYTGANDTPVFLRVDFLPEGNTYATTGIEIISNEDIAKKHECHSR